MVDQIAHRIRQLRQERGMTQVGLAAAANLSQTAVSAIERGEHTDIGIKTLVNIANALSVPVERLLGVEPPVSDPAPVETVAA